MRCKSGRHEWTNPDDAAKCCNGYVRILLLGGDATGVAVGQVAGIAYGYGWMRDPQYVQPEHPEYFKHMRSLAVETKTAIVVAVQED